MKKTLIALFSLFFVLPIVIVLGVHLAWTPVIAPQIKAAAEKSLKDQGYELKIESIDFDSWFLPIALVFANVSLEDSLNTMGLQISRVEVSIMPKGLGLDLDSLNPRISLHLTEPKLWMRPSSKQKMEKEQKPGTDDSDSSSASKIPFLNLVLSVDSGQVQWFTQTGQQLWCQSINGSWTETMAQIHWKAQCGYQFSDKKLKAQFPLTIDSKKSEWDAQHFKTEDLTIQLAGIKWLNQGQLDWNQLSGQWQTQVDIPQLDSLARQGLIPFSSWSGKINSQAHWIFESGDLKSIKGKATFDKVKARFDKKIKTPFVEIMGEGSIQGQMEFDVVDQALKLSSNLKADLTPLMLYKPDLFYKAKSVPLKLSLLSKVEDKNVVIDSFALQLSRLQAQLKGVLATTANSKSRLSFNIHKTDLQGFEKIVLPLKNHPVRGHLTLQGRLVGDWRDLTKARVMLNPIDFNVTTGLSYQDKNKDLFLKGPLTAFLRGQLDLQGQQLNNADLSGRFNFNKMQILFGKLFEKSQNQNLTVAFKGQKKANQFEISNFTAQTFLGDLKAQGQISEPQKPKINVHGQIDKLDLVKVKKMVKVLQSYPLSGFLQSNFHVQGQYDSQLGIEKSPLILTGKMLHNTSLLKWQKAKAEEKVSNNNQGQKQNKAGEITPILPTWPIVQKAKLTIHSNIKKAIINDLSIDNLQLQASLNQGNLLAEMKAAQVFDGSMALTKLSSNLYKAPTYFKGLAKTKQINLHKVMTWALPQYKDLIKGSLNGQFNFFVPLPSHADVFKTSKSSGQLNINGFEISTLKIDDMINNLLKKIPGFKNSQRVKTKNVQALFKSEYQWDAGLLKFSKTDFRTPENHQLLAHGTFNVNKQLYLQGQLYVNGLKIKESLQSCLLDNQGRLEIPIEYKGPISEPKMTYAAQAIEKVGKKYIQCEGRAQVKKVESQINKKAQDLLKKEAKKLKDFLKF